MIAVQIDTSRANAILSGLREAMVGKGMDASHIVEDETKQLCRAIVNFTPPLGPGGRAAGSKQAGEAAIQRENSNLISEARPGFLSMVSERWGIKDVSGYVESQGKSPLKLNFANVDPSGNSLSSLHESYRDRRGKVPVVKQPAGIWNARILTAEGNRQPFITLLQNRVGMWKATWAYPAFKLGSRFPKWISAHFSEVVGLSVADFNHLKDPVKPYAIIGSKFPGGFARVQFVKDAVKSRIRSLRLKLRLILADYKSQVSNGGEITAAARRRPEMPIPVDT